MTPSTELADLPLTVRRPSEAPLGGERPAAGPLLSVLMPVYNERRTLKAIVRRVLESPTPIPLELVAVDDGSTDGSADLLRELAAHDPRIRPVFHDKNRGKGAAIQTAIREMTGDIAIIQDADLEYDPAEIGKVIQPIVDGRADAVFGSRFLSSDYRRVLYYWHSLGNGALTWLCNVLCDINLTDMETCYKAVRADILRQTPLHFRDFALEPELTFRLAQWGIRLYEVPVSYAGRTYAEGKKIEELARRPQRPLGDVLGAGSWTPGSRRTTATTSSSRFATPERSTAGCTVKSPRSSARMCWRRGAGSATSPSCCSTATGWWPRTTTRSTSR